eukprot:TRINITY_DN5233_c0_g1_i1.p1 TRINITY_DN5233_c0_g1~~TRINITY_DN5233_c0_g1_i1.p1  ORF type:complete len:156 (+),score=7.02 TRINITY_DN5233_c0_g1_i1:77-544(+)
MLETIFTIGYILLTLCIILIITTKISEVYCCKSRDMNMILPVVLSINTIMFLCAYYLIFFDTSGEGDMWTYESTMRMFNTKTDQWKLGIWIEIISLQTVAAIWIYSDSKQLSIPIWLSVPCILIANFVGGFGVILYFVARSVFQCRNRSKETETH